MLALVPGRQLDWPLLPAASDWAVDRRLHDSLPDFGNFPIIFRDCFLCLLDPITV